MPPPNPPPPAGQLTLLSRLAQWLSLFSRPSLQLTTYFLPPSPNLSSPTSPLPIVGSDASSTSTHSNAAASPVSYIYHYTIHGQSRTISSEPSTSTPLSSSSTEGQGAKARRPNKLKKRRRDSVREPCTDADTTDTYYVQRRAGFLSTGSMVEDEQGSDEDD